MTDLSAQRQVALAYNAYERLVDSRMRLNTLLKPVRRAFGSDGSIPTWAGEDLIRAWAFALVTADDRAGGGTLGGNADWEAVMTALGAADQVDVQADVLLPSIFSAGPKRHRDEQFLRAKRARLHEPHIASITQFVDRVREETGLDVPYVDPDCGGVKARVLLVLEAPARTAAHGSGMLSADNDDETAKNVWHAYRNSGMPRIHGSHWNAVLGTSAPTRRSAP